MVIVMYLERKPFWLISYKIILTDLNAAKGLVLANSITVKHLNTKRRNNENVIIGKKSTMA